MPWLGLLLVRPAEAIPAFASQTGQACAGCHVGAYGPQLTPLGKAFKIGGYTQTGGVVDGGYEFLGDGTHIVVVLGIFAHEEQNLRASATGTGFGAKSSLNQVRTNVSY